MSSASVVSRLEPKVGGVRLTSVEEVVIGEVAGGSHPGGLGRLCMVSVGRSEPRNNSFSPGCAECGR